ncbi:MAG: FtsX-like permease family protein [Vicinamibacteria bacterium]|jgi:putative ABC transport system permease protein|nr:FtsX-like permease family protein [Vicinamibacteria bacterium]
MPTSAGRLASRQGSVPFSRRSLFHRRLRSALAISGIGFAVLFMFLQLGFRGTVEATAASWSSRLNGQVLLISPRFVDFRRPDGIVRQRLYQAMADPQVISVAPLYLHSTVWRNPDHSMRCEMMAFGLALDGELPLDLPELPRLRPLLSNSDAVLVDTLTQPKCGPHGLGTPADVNDRRRVQVAGQFRMGVGFITESALITGEPTYNALFGRELLEKPQIAVIRVRAGADPGAVVERLRRTLPADTRVITRAQFEGEQKRFWLEDTAVGNMFTVGTFVGFVVGIVILYQILSTDIRNQLPQYATLKAMGYPHSVLKRLVIEQAWLFAILGYIPGFLTAVLIYIRGRGMTLLPLFMTPERAIGVLLLSLVMCTVAALLSTRRLNRADPAELF